MAIEIASFPSKSVEIFSDLDHSFFVAVYQRVIHHVKVSN